MNRVYSSNSVNPKTYGHGNTEPSMEKSKACVETGRGISLWDKGTVRPFTKVNDVFETRHGRNIVTERGVIGMISFQVNDGPCLR